jgi:hypothetical protein
VGHSRFSGSIRPIGTHALYLSCGCTTYSASAYCVHIDMAFLTHKSSSSSDPAMAKSGATTAVSSQNVSTADLPRNNMEEKESQPVVMEEAPPSPSAEPAEATEKTEESTAVEEAKALDKPDDEEAEIEYPHGLKLAIITLALCLSVFLVALVSSFPTML